MSLSDHIYAMSIWMESVIDLRPKFNYSNLRCVSFSAPVDAVHGTILFFNAMFTTDMYI